MSEDDQQIETVVKRCQPMTNSTTTEATPGAGNIHHALLQGTRYLVPKQGMDSKEHNKF
jgi:hypothetical protein